MVNEFPTVLRASLLLLHAKLLLRHGSWRELVHRLPALPEDAAQASLQSVQRTTRLCYVAARLLPLRTECLERSFMTCSVLRGKGVRSELCIGVARVPPLSFHAWAEVDSTVMNDSPIVQDRFLTICRL